MHPQSQQGLRPASLKRIDWGYLGTILWANYDSTAGWHSFNFTALGTVGMTRMRWCSADKEREFGYCI